MKVSEMIEVLKTKDPDSELIFTKSIDYYNTQVYLPTDKEDQEFSESVAIRLTTRRES